MKNKHMNKKNTEKIDTIAKILKMWEDQREIEAATMCAKRRPTEVEIERAMIICKWFMGWNSETGPCPISISDTYWHKKLCALFEWIAVLESDNKKRGEK